MTVVPVIGIQRVLEGSERLGRSLAGEVGEGIRAD